MSQGSPITPALPDTPRCNGLESNPLDSFDYRAWMTLARQLERDLAAVTIELRRNHSGLGRAIAELEAIHAAVMNPDAVQYDKGDTLTVRRVKEFVLRAFGQSSENAPIKGWPVMTGPKGRWAVSLYYADYWWVKKSHAEAAGQQEHDIRVDREATISLIAESLGVSPEPHQTFFERLIEAASADHRQPSTANSESKAQIKVPCSSEGGPQAHDHEHRLSKSEVAGANPAGGINSSSDDKDTPTPRTDAAAFERRGDYADDELADNLEVVPADVARQIERDNNELVRITNAWAEIAAGRSTVQSATQAITDALRELVELKDMHDRVENRGNGISAEEAKELNREYRRRRPLAWQRAREVLGVTNG